MNKTAKAQNNIWLAIAGLFVAASGLNYGNGAQAGDSPEPHIKWVMGLGLFLLGIWLFSKRQNGLRRSDLKELLAGLAIMLVLIGFSLAVSGSGPSGLYQNDGYTVSGGLLILYGGGLIGFMLGERRAAAKAQSTIAEQKFLAKNKGGKK